ncbi:hypothetical protein LPJ61_004091 [Coemansia biformis]|uniref:Phosphodiest-domain-containing protein n=1 Tax=Coemansia biformis TaxID=1286918 RepID=A0A9W8CX37_9FUNG|nr:hypothetical protein LPJ61_004091 [Coemansia biformis]
MNGGEKDALVEDAPLTPPHGRARAGLRGRLTVVRGVGLLLLAIPALLVLLCVGAYIYNVECPADGPMPHAKPDYLSMWPVNKHDSGDAPVGAEARGLVSNGTHLFRPTLVLVSLDGFRADYLGRGLTPNLVRLGRQGLRADYMVPSFPSSTFPNHYSIVTGLYPGSHGIVSNSFYDTALNDTFVYSNSTLNLQSRWWEGGEPIWVTAERQGVKAAIDMWPGSTAAIRNTRPSYVLPFEDGVAPETKTRQLLEWLDLPLDRRPSFLAAYMPEVDHAGHAAGPDSEQVNSALQLVDGALGELWKQIATRNLTHIVNLMVVSDHGMTTAVPHKNAIYLDDIIDVSKLVGIYGWPLGGIQPKDDSDIPELFAKLKQASSGQPWKVYLRDELPQRYHYTHKTRVAPVLVIPDIHYYVTTRANDKTAGGSPGPGKGEQVIGLHGYDNQNPFMRATFVAVGPAFRARDAAPSSANASQPEDMVQIQAGSMRRMLAVRSDVGKEQMPDSGAHVSDMSAEQEYLELVRGALVSSPGRPARYRAEYDNLWGDEHLGEAALRNIRHPPFENVELYGLMARILGVTPAPNNGTSEFSSWWLC